VKAIAQQQLKLWVTLGRVSELFRGEKDRTWKEDGGLSSAVEDVS
jgi:hypothetical protein